MRPVGWGMVWFVIMFATGLFLSFVGAFGCAFAPSPECSSSTVGEVFLAFFLLGIVGLVIAAIADAVGAIMKHRRLSKKYECMAGKCREEGQG